MLWAEIFVESDSLEDGIGVGIYLEEEKIELEEEKIE